MKSFNHMSANEALETISGDPKLTLIEKPVMVFNSVKASSFKDFQKTLLIIEPELLENVADFDEDHLKQVDKFYVYGCFIMSDGKVGGCILEKMKNGSYYCCVTNDDIQTNKLIEAESYLYKEWYKYEC